ncbi:MAG TPA: dehypoxanthine futalosine cyclase [Desulfonatronum sp.]|mgnify:CR=1 FL=1|nr:dehypoxanthine futalosine cyclase [Desulfonatronum sp.]
MMERRISRHEALELWRETDVIELGALAHARRMRVHPEFTVTYIVDRNINYTNVCVSGCKFCAFYRPPGHSEGYVLSREQLALKVQETLDLGGRQILLQGGMNPELDMDFYESMLAFIKQAFPRVAVHGFSPPEINFLAERSGLDLRTVIHRLIKAGLDSIPGGGAEILVDEIRRDISPRKCSTDAWLEVMAEAHQLGLKTTATMMFGHREDISDRVEHLFRVRDLQDRTGGFTAFIPWTFQPQNTRIDVPEASSTEYLKFLALSRLFLDNIANIQASWVTQGPHIGQMALHWGANDFGSTMIEENVVAATGVHFLLPEDELRALVRGAGFEPRRRRMDYSLEGAPASG